MDTGVARSARAPRSTTWNSGRFRSISTTRSPGPTPSARSPAAARATSSACSTHVQVRHWPLSFHRSAGAFPRSRAFASSQSIAVDGSTDSASPVRTAGAVAVMAPRSGR